MAPDGTFWLADEYGPSLFHVSQHGQVLERVVPKNYLNTDNRHILARLPEVLNSRKANRGFEAITYYNGSLYAFLQSPLKISTPSLLTRIIVYNPTLKKTTGQFAYFMEGNGSDKIGDAIHWRDDKFLVIERDDQKGNNSKKKIFMLDFRATSMSSSPAPKTNSDQ